MALLSGLTSRLKKVGAAIKTNYTTAVNAVKSAIGLPTKQTASALDFSNPVNKALQDYRSGKTTSPVPQQTPGREVPQVYPGSTGKGSNQNVSVSNYAPVSYKSGTKTSSGGSSAGRVAGDYSSQSYDVNSYGTNALSSSAPSSTTVNGNSIGGRTYNNPTAPSANSYEGQVLANNVSVGADPTTGTIVTPQISATTGTDVSKNQKEDATQANALEQYLNSLQKPIDEEKLYRKALRESGLEAAKQARASTQNQINAITAQMNGDLLRLRGTAAQEGVTEAVYGGQQAQVTREATIKLLPLQAQLAADQNNVELAESHLDTLYKTFTKDAQNSVDFYNKQAEAIYQYATAKEKRQLEEISAQKSFEQELLKDDMDFQRSNATQALKDGNIRLYNALTGIRPPTNINSPTYQQDKANYTREINEAVSKYGRQADTKAGALASLPVSIQGKLINIADDFGSKDIVKKYNATVDAINIVNGIDSSSTNPSDHQQIVYAFAKSLDPESVVREGEYATIAKYAQSVLSRYKKEFTSAIDGTGFLSTGAIDNIKTTMNNTFASRKPIYENAFAETKRVINNLAGFDVANDILINYAGGIGGQQTDEANLPASKGTLQSGITYEVEY